jgi:hypothetical protein
MKTELEPPGRCDACGGELEFRREGSVQGYYCKNCGWSVVTTYIPEVELDETIYQVRVSGADYHNEAQVRAVASAAGTNFIEARRLLKDDPHPLIFEGRANQVVKARAALVAVGLRFAISPQFNH